MSKGTTMKSARITSAAALAVGILAVAVFAAPAAASMQIGSFTTTSSSSQAGGHPDLTTSFDLVDPGVAESAKNVVFQAPEGIFGTPAALLRCTSKQFALNECGPNSQAGLITVRANYSGSPSFLLGTVPLYELEPGEDNTAVFAFVTPILNIPIQIPVAVRTGSDYGLRFTVSNITQVTPLAGADLTFWGFPSSTSHNLERFPKGTPSLPAGCVGASSTSCLTKPISPSLPNKPLIHNPTTCTGRPLVTKLEVQTYQDPGNLTEAESSYPAVTECEEEVFKPVLYSRITTNETDSASGLDIELVAPQFFGQSPSPSQLRSAVVTLPPDLTINPDAADGQTACSDSMANFGTEKPMACPDTSKIGTFSLNTPALDAPLVGCDLHRPAGTRQPVPAVSGGRRLCGARQACRRGKPRSEDRSGHRLVHGSTSGSVR